MDITTTAKTVAAIASASLAFSAAADLPQLDSSQFDYKYEMLKLPTAENLDGSSTNDFAGGGSWLSLGTGADLGSLFMAINANSLLKSEAKTGNDGDGWQTANPTAAADGGTGYTVETRLKVTVSSGSYGALVLNASTGDSSVNSWLVFTTNSVSWGHAAPTASNTITNFDATAWHTYRIVREPGTTVHSVWIDGTLAADNLASGISAQINRLVLGSASGNYVGKAQVAYLRFHKGAYAPLDPDDKTRCKTSTDFSVQYEMHSDDTRIPLSGNSSYWKTGGSGATIGKSAGVLSVTTAGKSAYWDTTDSAWKNHVSAVTPFTAEFRIRISACTQSGADRAFNFITGTPGPLANLFIGTNSVQWCLSTSGAGTYVTLDNNDNTDEMHSFRISYSGGGRHAFTIWRDGKVIGENLVDCTNFYEYSGNALGIVRFGKAGGQNDGSWNLDYIRWDTTGAWDWKDPPSAFVMAIR